MKRSYTDYTGRRPFPFTREIRCHTAGFSLVELLIAMFVGLLILGAMYNLFAIQNKTFGNQESQVVLQQNVRAGMDMMIREIGMAGYDPSGANSDTNGTNNFNGITYNTGQLQVQSDLDGNGTIDLSSQENITYIFDAGNMRITRNIGAGNQNFIENVETFTFAYLDGNGSATTTTANIRRVRITITGRTARPDPEYPGNGGYRTYTLTSTVVPRNLAY